MGIQIKKFQGPTLQKAIEQIRAEMGDNAIILQTEPIKDSGALGLFGKNTVEVTAAIDRKELPARFHATVGEDTAEREVATAPRAQSAKANKAHWFSFLQKAKKGSTESSAQPALRAATESVADEGEPKPSEAERFTKSATASMFQNVNQLYAVKTFIEPLQRELEDLKSQMKPINHMAPAPRRKVRDPLEAEVQQLRAELGDFINERRFENSKLPPYYRQLSLYWMQKGMSKRQITQFFKAIDDWGCHFDEKSPSTDVASAIATALEGSITEANVFNQSTPRIVVLVGPTGVGKTTTIAKMAAHEKLRQKKSVALVTIDDYKIGGIDQIAHYGRILEVPFVKTRGDLSLEDQCRHLNADTIFIDTFGVSPFDEQRLQTLKKVLNFVDPEMKARVETHLVLPVGISSSDVQASVEKFAELDAKYLIFTKWDETENWGGMLSTILSARKPVSFICNGQDVPDAMNVFSKKNFIEIVTTFFNEGTPV